MKILFTVISLFIIPPLFAQTSIPIKYKQVRSIRKVDTSLFEEIREPDNQNHKIWHKKWKTYKLCENNDPKKSPSILEEIYEDKWDNHSPLGWNGGEGYNVFIKTIKWDYDGKGYNTKVWEIDTIGSFTSIAYDNFYIITQRGCCSTESKYYYFSLINGKHIVTLSSPSSEIIPIGKNRFFAFLNADLANTYKIYHDKKRHDIGYLFSTESSISNVDIVDDSFNMDRPKIQIQDTNNISLIFQKGNIINIGINNDQLFTKK
jgi:hypothetical protein